MKIYFVRHGESELNATNTHQFAETPLSKQGINQANIVARRFESIPIDKALASDYSRALQTAQIICDHNDFSLELEENLRERRWPSEIIGKERNDPDIVHIKKTLKDNAHDPLWHYSDEENLHDVEIRAEKCLKRFNEEKENGTLNLLVVSHGTFIRTLVLKMMLHENINKNVYYAFRDFMVINNTGITLIEWKDGMWKLLTWNDFAHLG